jgi:hypothetical protein
MGGVVASNSIPWDTILYHKRLSREQVYLLPHPDFGELYRVHLGEMGAESGVLCHWLPR